MRLRTKHFSLVRYPRVLVLYYRALYGRVHYHDGSRIEHIGYRKSLWIRLPRMFWQ